MSWSSLSPTCVEDAPLAPLTHFRLGGSARVLATVESAEQLADVLSRAHRESLPVYVLGSGANVLVADDGVDGVVVRLRGGRFGDVEWDGPRVSAGAGVDIGRLALAAIRRGLRGLECMAGIPGTVGGCIRMNAGGKFGQISDVVRRVWTVDRSGCRREWKNEELGFGYRRCGLRDEIIERAEFALTPCDPDMAMRRYREVWDYKKMSQPLAANSAGCVFKNPPGVSAGALIDRAGLKGTSVGGAVVSPEHANFILATDGASASDVLALIRLIRRRVAEQFGVDLELEVKVWGKRWSEEESREPGMAGCGATGPWTGGPAN
mgnify:CR=1 FL=1